MNLGQGIYEEPEDKQAAIEMPREIIAAGPRPRLYASGLNRWEEFYSASDATQMTSKSFPSAHSVEIRLKGGYKTSSGDLGESCTE